MLVDISSSAELTFLFYLRKLNNKKEFEEELQSETALGAENVFFCRRWVQNLSIILLA